MKNFFKKENVFHFASSPVFIIVLSILSFLSWVVKGNWIWCFLPLYAFLCIAPLTNNDGRGYLPLLFYILIIDNQDIHFNGGIPPSLIFCISFYLGSLLLYLFIHKPKMVTGKIFFSLLALFISFLVSFLINIAKNGSKGSIGILYIITLFIVLCLYSLLNSVLGKDETLPYFCLTIACFSIAAALETNVELFKQLFETNEIMASNDFSLGWSYTRDTISTFLTLSLPFFAILINKKQIQWFAFVVYILLILFLLSTDSFILSLLFFVIPFVILTLKDYSKASLYYIMFSFLAIGIIFGLMMAFNETFKNRIVMTVSRLNLFSDNTIEFYKPVLEEYISNPIFGSSIANISNENGTVSLIGNTLLSSMQLGGSIGLGFYLIYDIFVYIDIFKKDSKEKWFILLFYLNLELIGLINNTIYNIFILIFTLTTLSVFQQSNKQEEVIVHQDFFKHFEKEEQFLKNINNV